MSAERQPDAGALEVTTPAGHVINLEPLVTAAHGIRRNALAAAEHEHMTGLNGRDMQMVLMGLRIAVRELCGEDAEAAFDARVSGSREPFGP